MTTAAIAESPASLLDLSPDTPADQSREPLSVRGVVASLQILLAARRAARNEDFGYWYSISRGM